MKRRRTEAQKEAASDDARPVTKRPGRRGPVGAADEPKPAPLSERRRRRLEERMLKEIARAAKHCLGFEELFKAHPAPSLETLVSLHRVLTLNLSTEAGKSPMLLKLVNSMMKPLLEWAALEEKRRARELKEEALRKESAEARAGKGLTEQTRGQIEEELGLLQAGHEPEPGSPNTDAH